MENEMVSIPFFVHEAELARAEERLRDEKNRADTRVKRYWVALAIVFLSFLCANVYHFGLNDGRRE